MFAHDAVLQSLDVNNKSAFKLGFSSVNGLIASIGNSKAGDLHEAIDHVKKLKGSVSEDHLKRYTKDIEAVMEKKIEKIVKILKDKEVELMK